MASRLFYEVQKLGLTIINYFVALLPMVSFPITQVLYIGVHPSHLANKLLCFLNKIPNVHPSVAT